MSSTQHTHHNLQHRSLYVAAVDVDDGDAAVAGGRGGDGDEVAGGYFYAADGACVGDAVGVECAAGVGGVQGGCSCGEEVFWVHSY